MADKEKFFTARGYEISADEDTLTPSMEDYIEMIYRLSGNVGHTRTHDLASSLNVQPPSVTKMIQKLNDKNLIVYEKYGNIQLTVQGQELGKYFLERHNIVKNFLIVLGIEENVQKHVEQIEHYIGWNTFQAFQTFVEFMEENEHIQKQYITFRNNREKFLLSEKNTL
ncbi:DNA-binding protein [Desulfuribacillus stibiiarsenatis]|uniref:Manganese transport regulator n=1 Tax=Desulfuribacillus stibiiarsenatis TaxID=1390249 RepID=A0A1E5L9P6_9FIRM|nr:transcriptional regulator MntR [Desulfuribacillus stibiiarsenatis]OEH86861.1 DNA-binding protein [Desulfuribacillus stibiiarsenatis]